jgi:hypothetical protein
MRPGDSLHGMSDYAKANIVSTPQTNRKSDHGALPGKASGKKLFYHTGAGRYTKRRFST